MNEQIDWSKAPADATHYHPRVNGYVDHWIKPGFFCVVGFEGEGWKKTSGDALGHAVPRPTAAPAWNGPEDGLPPVGTVCEFQGDEAKCPSDPWHEDLHDGVKCTVIAHFKSKKLDLVAFTFVKPDGNTEVEQSLPGALAPVRTPEQIAAQVRSDAIDVMCKECGYDGGGASYYTCAGLYDAGWRKQVQP